MVALVHVGEAHRSPDLTASSLICFPLGSWRPPAVCLPLTC